MTRRRSLTPAGAVLRDERWVEEVRQGRRWIRQRDWTAVGALTASVHETTSWRLGKDCATRLDVWRDPAP